MSVVVKSSKIHGQGLFAEKGFKRGDVILEWASCTKFPTAEQVEDLPSDERKYLSYIEDRYVLFLPPARFVNHSCNPNAKGGGNCDVAACDIAAGEEITVDYVAEQVPGLHLQCTCGTENCRGLLAASKSTSDVETD